MLGPLGDVVGFVFGNIFYPFWIFFTIIVDMVEDVFMGLAGLGPVYVARNAPDGTFSPDQVGVGGQPGDQILDDDIISVFLQHGIVRNLFQNMIIVAVALIMFFTIIQIIREQIKDKTGGNPYMIVFRMFRGMITMLFVTAAVLVGLQLNQIVFQALNRATGGSDGGGASGAIFRGMSHEANRLRLGGRAGAFLDSDGEGVYTIRRGRRARTWGGDAGFEGGVTREYYYNEFGGIVARVDDDGDGGVEPVDEDDTGIIDFADLTLAQRLADMFQAGEIPEEYLNRGENGSVRVRRSFLAHLDGGNYRTYGAAILVQAGQSLNFTQQRVMSAFGGWSFIPIVTYNDLTLMRLPFQFVDRRNLPDGSPPPFNPFMYRLDLQQATRGRVDRSLQVFTNQTLDRGADGLLGSLGIAVPGGVSQTVPSAEIRRQQRQNMGDSFREGFDNWFAFAESWFKMAFLVDMINFVEWILLRTFDSLSAADFTTQNPFLSFLQTMFFTDQSRIRAWPLSFTQAAFAWSGSNYPIMPARGGIVLSRDDQAWGGFNIPIASILADLDVFQNIIQGTLGMAQAAIDAVQRLTTFADGVERFVFHVPIVEHAAEFLRNFNARSQSFYRPNWQARGIGSVGYSGGQILPSRQSYGSGYVLSNIDDGDYMPMTFGPGEFAESIRDYIHCFDFHEATFERMGLNKSDFGSNGQISRTALQRMGMIERTAEETAAFRLSNGQSVDRLFTFGDHDGIGIVALAPERMTNSAVLHNNGLLQFRGNTAAHRADAADEIDRLFSMKPTDRRSPDGRNRRGLFMNVSGGLSEQGVAIMGYLEGAYQASYMHVNDVGLDHTDLTYYRQGIFAVLQEAGVRSRRSNGYRLFNESQRQRGEVNDPWISPTNSNITNISNIRGVMGRFPEFANDNLKDINQTEPGIQYGIGRPVSYRRQILVNQMYQMSQMNMIIGFLGILIVLGVYVNFAFALIQRIVEMIVLYIMSPITLAMYPIDNGQAFQSKFVQPFYKKAIAVYSIILSLNLFFMLFPLFNAVQFFPQRQFFHPNTLYNAIMSVFVTLCLLSMLPKVRDTINEALGAEQLQEKKLGEIRKDALEKTGVAGAMKGVAKARGHINNIAAKAAHNRRQREQRIADGKGTRRDKIMNAIDNNKAARGLRGLNDAKNKKLDALGKKIGNTSAGYALSKAFGKSELGKEWNATGGRKGRDRAQKAVEKQHNIQMKKEAKDRVFGQTVAEHAGKASEQMAGAIKNATGGKVKAEDMATEQGRKAAKAAIESSQGRLAKQAGFLDDKDAKNARLREAGAALHELKKQQKEAAASGNTMLANGLGKRIKDVDAAVRAGDVNKVASLMNDPHIKGGSEMAAKLTNLNDANIAERNKKATEQAGVDKAKYMKQFNDAEKFYKTQETLLQKAGQGGEKQMRSFARSYSMKNGFGSLERNAGIDTVAAGSSGAHFEADGIRIEKSAMGGLVVNGKTVKDAAAAKIEANRIATQMHDKVVRQVDGEAALRQDNLNKNHQFARSGYMVDAHDEFDKNYKNMLFAVRGESQGVIADSQILVKNAILGGPDKHIALAQGIMAMGNGDFSYFEPQAGDSPAVIAEKQKIVKQFDTPQGRQEAILMGQAEMMFANTNASTMTGLDISDMTAAGGISMQMARMDQLAKVMDSTAAQKKSATETAQERLKQNIGSARTNLSSLAANTSNLTQSITIDNADGTTKTVNLGTLIKNVSNNLQNQDFMDAPNKADILKEQQELDAAMEKALDEARVKLSADRTNLGLQEQVKALEASKKEMAAYTGVFATREADFVIKADAEGYSHAIKQEHGIWREHRVMAANTVKHDDEAD